MNIHVVVEILLIWH